MITISVILPVYNAEKTIKRVLQSVYDQTCIQNIIEIIVVNDGSTDESERKILEFSKDQNDSKIKYIKQSNSGASCARNKGIQEAKGDYIALLDADDLWMPNKIERQLAVIKDNPEIVFLGTGYFMGKEKREIPLRLKGKTIHGLYRASLHDIYWKHFPPTPSVIFRKDATRVVGYFDENQHYGEDINYFQKFCINYNYYYLSEPLLHVGFDKSYFGSYGLSSNFKAMHEGTLKNLRELKLGGHFSFPIYLLYRIYFQLKYWRRCIIRFFNKLLNNN